MKSLKALGFGLLVSTALTSCAGLAPGDATGVKPLIGFRVKLQTRGEGKWAMSTGDNAKFGLNTAEILFAVEKLRAALGEPEIRRYKALGRDCALVMETVIRQLTPGDSEYQAEADLARDRKSVV